MNEIAGIGHNGGPQLECPVPEIFEPFLQPARFKVCYGGRGSSKTRTVITLLVNNVLYSGWRVMCLRELMESIADSSYAEIVEEIERRNLGHWFKITKTEIHCPISGGMFKFTGIKASSKRLQGQKLKALANFDAAFIDEGESVTQDSWNALVPTMRKNGSEIYVCFNPANPLDFIYQAFVTNPIYPPERHGRAYCITLKVNYTDNPFFPQELADDAELMRQVDPELYRHVYLGEPVAGSELAIIKPVWIEAAIDAHLHVEGFPMTGGRFAGFDVSGGVEGDVKAPKQHDPNAYVARHGCVMTAIEEWQDDNPNSAAGQAYSFCRRDDVEAINADDIGVGASVPAELRRLDGLFLKESRKSAPLNIAGWTASESPHFPTKVYQYGKTNEDTFYNLKAQGWIYLADRFRNTWQARNGLPYDADKLISLPSGLPHLARLSGELSQPRREIVNGKEKVESKANLKKRGVASTNLADAAIMAFWEGKRPMQISKDALSAI